MTTPLAPIEAYQQRAGNAPKPQGYVDLPDEHEHDLDAAVAWALGDHPLAATPRIFWADISEFQSPVTSAYPWQQLAIRLDTGWRLDNNAVANHRKWPKLNRTGFLMGYVVFIPGQSGPLVKRLQNNFGRHLEGIAPMVDMESGRGFAGPGNHSSEANDLVATLAELTGSRAREVGYANGNDWAANWPGRPKWLKRIVANYSSTIVAGCWAQQYHGGGNWPVPAGWPRSVKPWGSYIDLNSAALTVAGAKQALALAPAPKPPTPPTPTPAPTEDAAILEWIMSLPGAPKGLTYDQFLDAIAHRVWFKDQIESPTDSKTNPTWAPASYLRNMFLKVAGK